MADELDPSKPSGAYRAMAPFWKMVRDILAGAPALRAIQMSSVSGPLNPVPNAQLRRGNATQSPYLPKFQNELDSDYQCRVMHAPLTNIYADISSNLAAKPFGKHCKLDEESSEELIDLSTDIDGQGHDMHVFSSDVFKAAMDFGFTFILVDYTKVTGTTLADERGVGARPYWVHILPERMRAIYSEFLNGREVITHARIDECYVKRVEYDEVMIERVRQMDREPVYENGVIVRYGAASYTLWERIKEDEKSVWTVVDQGPITLGYIPIVPVVFGKRSGWVVDPPLKDIVYQQIEDFQQESNLKAIKELTAFPMLAGNGVPPPVDAAGNVTVVPVGPKAVLFSPPGVDGDHGEWTMIEPAGTSLTFLADDLDRLQNRMKTAGMQPLTSANMNVIGTANLALRAANAVQYWALLFKDALEGAWMVTCDWLKTSDTPKIIIHTDFGIDLTGPAEIDALLKAQIQGVISKVTTRDELKRRGILADDLDTEAEDELLAEEQQGLEPEEPMNPSGGPITVAPQQMDPLHSNTKR